MSLNDTIREITRRMHAVGSNMKRLSLGSGNNETYVRDLLTGQSENPKTEHLQRVMDELDRLEAEQARIKMATRMPADTAKKTQGAAARWG